MKKQIETQSFQELENQVHVLESVKSAVLGITMQIGLGMEETSKFFDAVVNGPENVPIFDIVRLKSKNITEEKILNILSFIHDSWVISNSNETISSQMIKNWQMDDSETTNIFNSRQFNHDKEASL